MKLEFGNIRYRIAENLDLLVNAEFEELERPGYKKTSFLDKIHKNENDIILFNRILLEVEAREFSKFNFKIQPKNKFIELIAFENELIKTDPKDDTYLYFSIDE